MMMVPLFFNAAATTEIYTYRGLVIAYSVSSVPFSIWSMKGYYDTIPGSLEEAATIDGATQLQKIRHITLPTIVPTIVILLILNLGNMLNVGFEKIILLYTPASYETADVISTYVYRRGLQENNFGFGTAVGLFNSVINFALIVLFNKLARRISSISLW